MIRRLLAALACCVSLAAHAFDLEGHRGARGLAPENTRPAFAKALSIGVGTLELDVGVTRDGQVVVMHDTTVDGKTNGTGTPQFVQNVRSYTQTVGDVQALAFLSQWGQHSNSPFASSISSSISACGSVMGRMPFLKQLL